MGQIKLFSQHRSRSTALWSEHKCRMWDNDIVKLKCPVWKLCFQETSLYNPFWSKQGRDSSTYLRQKAWLDTQFDRVPEMWVVNQVEKKKQLENTFKWTTLRWNSSPTFCGCWLMLLVSTDSMASLAPRYSKPEERSRRKVLKLVARLNTSGPRTLEPAHRDRGGRCQHDCQSSEVDRKLWGERGRGKNPAKSGLDCWPDKHFSQKKRFKEIKDIQRCGSGDEWPCLHPALSHNRRCRLTPVIPLNRHHSWPFFFPLTTHKSSQSRLAVCVFFFYLSNSLCIFPSVFIQT